MSFLISRVHTPNEQLVNLLKHCFKHKQKGLAKVLLKRIDFWLIMENYRILSFKIIKFCFSHGYEFCINSSFLENFTPVDSSGNTLLHVACQYNASKVVKNLVGCNHTSICNNTGDTPLHTACAYNYFKIVEILMQSEADVTVRNSDGNTPLHVASMSSSYKCIKSLGTAEFNERNDHGNTALHLACSVGSYACVTALSSSSLCAKNISGNTPLHIACQYGSFSIVYYLLNYSDVIQALSTTNNDGELPLHIALRSFGKKEMNTFVRLHAFFQLINLTPIVINHQHLIHLACQCKVHENYKIAQYFKSRNVAIDVRVMAMGDFPYTTPLATA